MILGPRCKPSIFGEKTWSDTDPEPYAQGYRRRFELDHIPTGSATANPSSFHGIKPPASDEDDEFLALLAERAAQRSDVHDYDRYANLPNNPTIKSALGWWRGSQGWFPDLAKMARDTSAVPASCCSMERMFSVSGRIAAWQRSHLRDSILGSDLMMYKAAMNLTDAAPKLGEEDLPVPEMLGKIPAVEREQEWWKRKLRRTKVRSEILERFREDNE
jgi:hAT family C-terminal dimerisation region